MRNPNGDFNINPGGAFHAFDYAASDYVNLTAGNLVQLGASSSALPRLSGIDSLKVPVIYPGILNIAAGAGGVVLDGDSTYNQLILYPSPQGSLTINTAGGGSLTGDLPAISGTPQIFNLIVSDSGREPIHPVIAGGYFGLNDHAASPVHLNSETPVVLNISGSMNFMMLGAPEAAQINVVGDMNNSAFQGMNLSADPNLSVTVPVREIDGSMGTAKVYPGLTSITVGQAAKINLENSGILNPATDGGLTVGGDIVNRSAFTSIDLTQLLAAGAAVPDLSLLAQATDNTVNGNSISAATLATSFYYNPTTKILTYQNIKGVSLSGLLQLLQNLTVQKVDANGNPLWLDPEQTIPDTTTASVLDATTTQALLTEYNALGAIPSGASGYIIGGGGKFNITAHNWILAPRRVSSRRALVSIQGRLLSACIPTVQPSGADIGINLAGDLDMYSSAIASLNGGNISITSGGDINVGSSDFSVTALGARGIFTTGQGNVNVFADGPHANINVNGSRIAAYDGGNVTVESLQGDVNAGSGGSGFVVVNAFSVDPATHNVTTSTPTIPGSGILATTFPDDAGQAVGNILVETPNGNVNTSSGGIVQLPLNNGNSQNATVEVLAGYELRDPAGNRVTAADISSGTPVSVSGGGNIDASGSGVIAENAVLKASGEIQGVVFSKNNITLDAGIGITSLTALGKSIDATAPSFGPTVTLIGTEHVNAAGAAPSQILSQDANGGGTTFAQGTVANATSQAASASDAAAPATKTDTSTNDDSLKKKKNITLARKISRVTVLLPGKN